MNIKGHEGELLELRQAFFIHPPKKAPPTPGDSPLLFTRPIDGERRQRCGSALPFQQIQPARDSGPELWPDAAVIARDLVARKAEMQDEAVTVLDSVSRKAEMPDAAWRRPVDWAEREG